MSIQILINGFISGLGIGLTALGFAMVFLSTRVFHIALAAVYTAAPYITWFLMDHGTPWFLASIVAIFACGALSICCEICNHRWLENGESSEGTHLVSSLGIYIVLVQVIAITWGTRTKVLQVGASETIRLGSILLTYPQVFGGLGAIFIFIAFFIWLKYANLGIQFRALADNPDRLSLLGYNINKLRVIAFGLSGCLAASGGLFQAYESGFDPHGGLPALLLAIVAVIIGGRGSFVGPVLGGILLGLIRSQVVWFLSAEWQDAVTFLLLCVFLYVRPQGILGQELRLEAE